MLTAAVDELAASLTERPKFALEATKAHVNAVVSAMSVGDTSYADSYIQAASWLDPEVRERAADYFQAFAG